MTKTELFPLKNFKTRKATKAESVKSTIGLFELYRFSNSKDWLLMAVGSFCAIVDGLVTPLSFILFGRIFKTVGDAGRLNDFLEEIQDFLLQSNLTKAGIMKEPPILIQHCHNVDAFYNVTNACDGFNLNETVLEALTFDLLGYLVLFFLNIISSWGLFTLWSMVAERQTIRMRSEFFKNILYKEIGWFDQHNPTELNSLLAGNIERIESGIGDKVGKLISNLACPIAAFIIAFHANWRQAAVTASMCPLLVLSTWLIGFVSSRSISKELLAYSKAGAVAEEVLGAIRTVMAFGGEEKEAKRYETHLLEVEKYGRRKGIAVGWSMGLMTMTFYITYSLGLWYGGKLQRDYGDSPDGIITAFFSIFLSTMSLGFGVPSYQALMDAKAAAYQLFQHIDSKPESIDSSSKKGKTMPRIIGSVRFQNVHFAYPSRRDEKVLKGLDLQVEPGQTVALVGASGCGKSTTTQLLLRFYDPHRGKVTIDGVDLKDLNVGFLRRSIGLVSQEPVLFDTTIEENIRYGRDDITQKEIIEAAKNANALDFISRLPYQFNTRVGEGGTQLSGGQKQRIAIARALVRDPKILVLDEATSALDTESESVVQDALDRARKGRTTLVIAHRLSTIQTADVIVAIDQGIVKEKGNHSQLMRKEGIYFRLVTNQTLMKENHDFIDIDTSHVKRVVNKNESNSSYQIIEGINTRGVHGHSLEGQGEEAERTRIQILLKGAQLRWNGHVAKYALTVTFPRECSMNPEASTSASVRKLMLLNSAKLPTLALGCLGAVMYGAAQTPYAFFIGGLLAIISMKDESHEDLMRNYSLAILGLGVISSIGIILQNSMFAIYGDALTKELRLKTFKALLKQEVGWFDRPENSTGAITTMLANDAQRVKEASGVQLGSIIQCFVIGIATTVVSFIYGWKLTLCIIIFFPLTASFAVVQIKAMGSNAEKNSQAMKKTGKIVSEAFLNIKTVASLSVEKEFIKAYDQTLNIMLRSLFKSDVVAGLIFSFCRALIHCMIGVSFACGGYFIMESEMNTTDMIMVFIFILICGYYLGNALVTTPDVGKGLAAAKIVLNILQRKTRIDVDLPGQKIPDDELLQSDISFEETHFRYPTRPDVPVTQGLTLNVRPGQTVALVGSSGCGKSTCIALLQRLYDVHGGSVKLGGYALNSLDIKWLRSQLGLVSQEPVVFDYSVAENIAYGDNTRTVTHDEVVEAARKANIHHFIAALPKGYETNVGLKGTQLSGGQKQRIAIARALVREPKILLLDEATSALDTESEKIVQEALDKARVGRTCIVIAHRLSTVQDVDKIIAIDQGRVVEQGTHRELVARRGAYHRLYFTNNK